MTGVGSPAVPGASAYSGRMSLLRAPRRLAALLLVSVALTSLTACSGISSEQPSPEATVSTPDAREGAGDETGDAGQTTAEACALVQDTIEDATAEFEDVSAEDPAAVVEAMRSAADRIAAASSEITNDEVAALLPSLQSMFDKVADVMGAIASGDASKLADAEELGSGFQETSEKFQELCAP